MLNIEMLPPDELQPAAYNPRTISNDTMAKLKKGILEFGLVDPIIINADGTVIGGHQRLQAAKELGLAQVPCVRLDIDKQREIALNLALNKLSGSWDYDKLSSILGEFEGDLGFDFELTGFDNVEAAELGALGSIPTALSPTEGFGGPSAATDAPSGPEAHEGASEGNERPAYVIQYSLIFNNEDEQKKWHDFLRYLRLNYPGFETHSERICSFIDAHIGNQE